MSHIFLQATQVSHLGTKPQCSTQEPRWSCHKVHSLRVPSDYSASPLCGKYSSSPTQSAPCERPLEPIPALSVQDCISLTSRFGIKLPALLLLCVSTRITASSMFLRSTPSLDPHCNVLFLILSSRDLEFVLRITYYCLYFPPLQSQIHGSAASLMAESLPPDRFT